MALNDQTAEWRMPEASPTGPERLGIGLKALYGSGQILDSVANTIITTFLFFYVTAVCGLPNSLAGMALGAALVIDAFADPFIGSLSDNTVSRLGRRHPFLFGSILPLAVAFGLLFSIPRGLPSWGLFAYVTAMALAVRVTWSAFGLPYAALGAELSEDYHERSSIVAWRQFFGITAQIACIWLGLSVFLNGREGLLDRAGYPPLAWTCALVIALGAALAAFGTLPLRRKLHAAPGGAGHPVVRLFREIGEVIRNPSFRYLAASVVIFFIAQGSYLVLLLHALKFFWALPQSVIQWATLATQFGLLAGLPLMALVGRRLEKRIVLIAGVIIIGAGEFFLPLGRIFHVLPNAGPVLYATLIVVLFILGAMSTCATIAFQSAFADATDEHELLFGARREGLYYAALSLAVKAAAGIGSLIAGIELDLIGFPSDIAAHPHIHIAAETLRNLGLVYGPLAALITSIGAIVLLGYRLDQTEHARILQQLRLRRVSR